MAGQSVLAQVRPGYRYDRFVSFHRHMRLSTKRFSAYPISSTNSTSPQTHFLLPSWSIMIGDESSTSSFLHFNRYCYLLPVLHYILIHLSFFYSTCMRTAISYLAWRSLLPTSFLLPNKYSACCRRWNHSALNVWAYCGFYSWRYLPKVSIEFRNT